MRAKVPLDIRREIERWYAAKQQLGTMKGIANRLEIPQWWVANVCQRMRERQMWGHP
jgi:hypothetical protein